MPRTSTAVAAGCGLLAAPLFVSPSPARPPVERIVASGVAPEQGEHAAGANAANMVTPLVGMGAAAVLAAASRSRGRGPKVARAAFDPTKERGVQAPIGFWDPAGFCNDGNEANFKRRRAVEIKHGRISMLACIGYIVPEYFRFPGYLSPSQDIKFADVPNGLGALSKVPVAGWAQIFAFGGLLETALFKQVGDEPGNLGQGNLGLLGLLGPVKDPKERERKLNAEIANGRLAMFAIMGFLFQNGVTGTAGPAMYGWGEASDVIIPKIVVPCLLAFAFAGETFRRGPDEKFLKFYKRSDYFGKDKRI